MPEEGRIMALDIGDVRTGVAVTDPLRIIASPHSVVEEPTPEAAVAAIRTLVEELAPVRIVAGVPLDREGKRGPQAEKTLAMVERLRAAVDVEIVLQDERFTTVNRPPDDARGRHEAQETETGGGQDRRDPYSGKLPSARSPEARR